MKTGIKGVFNPVQGIKDLVSEVVFSQVFHGGCKNRKSKEGRPKIAGGAPKR